jgi:seryl-tRNA synthetase
MLKIGCACVIVKARQCLRCQTIAGLQEQKNKLTEELNRLERQLQEAQAQQKLQQQLQIEKTKEQTLLTAVEQAQIRQKEAKATESSIEGLLQELVCSVKCCQISSVIELGTRDSSFEKESAIAQRGTGESKMKSNTWFKK